MISEMIDVVLKQFDLSSKSRSFWLGMVIIIMLIVALAAIFYLYVPVGVDWEYTFTDAARKWRDPYQNSLFTNPPWALIFLPHAFLPLKLGNAINLLLNFAVLLFVIRKFGGGTSAIMMVFTSPFILDLARTNNIDWIPALSLVVPPVFGVFLLSVKPQTLGFVALVWWREQGFTPRILVPTLTIAGLSFLVYGFWVSRLAGLPADAGLWNIAPFPLGIPLGLYLLYLAYRAKEHDDSLIFAALATVFITPYIAPYSLNTIMAMGASRYRREAFIAWVASWVYVIYTLRRNTIMFGGA